MQLRKLELLQEWFSQQENPSTSTWFQLTATSFRSWMTSTSIQRHNTVTSSPFQSPVNNVRSSFQPITPNLSSSFVHSTSTNLESEAAIFKKGTKRSVSDYHKLKDDSKWKQWKRHLKDMANSHGTACVLDPDYVPADLSEEVLFRAQNDFMYSVFEQCLLTSKSKFQVQLHEESMDAQMVYKGLLTVYEKDLSGELHAGDLRAELTLL